MLLVNLLFIYSLYLYATRKFIIYFLLYIHYSYATSTFIIHMALLHTQEVLLNAQVECKSTAHNST